jgi:hypothetical protein
MLKYNITRLYGAQPGKPQSEHKIHSRNVVRYAMDYSVVILSIAPPDVNVGST